MELLVLLLLIPIAWLLFLPARLAGALRRHRGAGIAVLAVVLVGGWLVLHALNPAPEARTDYAAGDAALRALLE